MYKNNGIGFTIHCAEDDKNFIWVCPEGHKNRRKFAALIREVERKNGVKLCPGSWSNLLCGPGWLNKEKGETEFKFPVATLPNYTLYYFNLPVDGRKPYLNREDYL